ncbi:hypothetical protein FRC09_015898 [Ceratobasidium sp. 395]|nr:hypothetical protein FRC09_015898 [Ceratobasidium sp. 395]
MAHAPSGLVSFDSELITHIAGALPVRTNHVFSALIDEHRNPLILSIGEDSRLYAIKVHADGRRRLVDLGSRLGVTCAIRTFSVSQAAQGALYVAFAAQKNDSPSEDLYIVAPFAPKLLDDNSIDMKPYVLQVKSDPIKGTGIPTDIHFEKIHLGFATSEKYPQAIVAFNKIGGQSDIARIVVDLTQKRWSWRKDIELPENAAKIIAVAPGNFTSGPGLFYLYQITSDPTIIFMGTDLEANNRHVQRLKLEQCPKDAKTVASFTDASGQSHLLVGAGGLWHYTPSAIRSGARPVRISEDPMYDGALENLAVALAGRDLSIWFENKDHTLGYQQGTLGQGGACTLHGPPVPLRPAGTCAEFAPLLDPGSLSQVLVVATTSGTMSLLEQAPLSRIWKETPLDVPSTDHNREYLAYMTHIQVTDSQGHPAAREKIRIACSDWVTATVNGRTVLIGTGGTDILTDDRGAVTLIVPTEDISTFIFTVTTPTTSLIPIDQPVIIDPSVKVKTKLGSVEDARSLSDVRLPDGSPLVDSGRDDLDSASKAIKQLSDMLSGSSGSETPPQELLSHDPIETIWDFFAWIECKVKEAYKSVVLRIKGAWHLVVSLGEKTWEFVLDTAARVQKAITFVFQQIDVSFKKLAQWLGYVFDWSDIKKTQESIVNVVNGVMAKGVTSIEGAEQAVEDTFARLKRVAESYVVDPQVASHTVTSQTPSQGPSEANAAANTSAYHYEHSGIKESLQARRSGPDDPNFGEVWENHIRPALSDIGGTLTDAAKGLVDMFLSGSQELSVGEILKRTGAKLITPTLEVAKRIALVVLKLAKSLVTTLKNAINFDLNDLPWIGPLLRKVTGGQKLTVLNTVALLLAIPATVFSKQLLGRAPTPVLESDFGTSDNLVPNSATRAFSELASTVQISQYIYATAMDCARIFTAEASDLDPTPPGNFSLVFELISNIFEYPPPSTEPASAYEARRAMWLVLFLRSLINAIVWKAPPFAGRSKAVVLVDAVAGTITFWLLQVIHAKELTEEYEDKDQASTGLEIGKSVADHIKNVAVVAGVLSLDPVTKSGAAVAVAATNAIAQRFQCGLHVRQFERQK